MNLYKSNKIIDRHYKTGRSLTKSIDSKNNSGDNRAAAQASRPYA